MFPLTLRPHGSNFEEVINALGSVAAMDKGMTIKIPREGGGTKCMFVCAFALAYTGDMP